MWWNVYCTDEMITQSKLFFCVYITTTIIISIIVIIITNC